MAVRPHQDGREHHERDEQGHERVEGDDDPEIAQEREPRGRDHREPTDQCEPRGHEGTADADDAGADGLLWRTTPFTLLDVARRDQDRELGTDRDHQRSGNHGERAQLEPGRVHDDRRQPHGQQHGHEGQEHLGKAAVHEREPQRDQCQREIGHLGAVRLQRMHERDTHHCQPRRCGPDAGRRMQVRLHRVEQPTTLVQRDVRDREDDVGPRPVTAHERDPRVVRCHRLERAHLRLTRQGAGDACDHGAKARGAQ